MNNKVKRYELNDNVTVDMLEKNGFRECGFIDAITKPKYYYSQYLSLNVYVQIEIAVKNDETLYFDDYISVSVIEDNFGQPYYPFYDKDQDFDYLNSIIDKYNSIMDKFMEGGIFTEINVPTKKLANNGR